MPTVRTAAAIAALIISLILAIPVQAAERSDAPSILFESVIPLKELRLDGWTPAQQKEIAYLIERMKRDQRIFVTVRPLLDPIGDRAESDAVAMALARSVASRLKNAGIPGDRIIPMDPERDRSLFGERRWKNVGRFQKIVISAMQGGAWLSAPAAAKQETVIVVKTQAVPKVGAIVIKTPVEGTTDRSSHRLTGTADSSIGSISVVVGREAKMATAYDGAFDVPIRLRKGMNRIVVSGLDAFGRSISATRNVDYDPPIPSIDLYSPEPGAVADLTRSPLITVRGRVNSRNDLRKVFIAQNGIPRQISFGEDNTFSWQAVLVGDEDLFALEAIDSNDEAGVSEERTVVARSIADRPLMAILHWDDGDADLDLHIRDEKGRHTFFEAKSPEESAQAIPGGKLWLDNRTGFGPEVFTLEKEFAGELTVSIRQHRGKAKSRAFLTLILDAGSPSRRRVRLFGPIDVAPGAEERPVVAVTLPAGDVREIVHGKQEEKKP